MTLCLTATPRSSVHVKDDSAIDRAAADTAWLAGVARLSRSQTTAAVAFARRWAQQVVEAGGGMLQMRALDVTPAIEMVAMCRHRIEFVGFEPEDHVHGYDRWTGDAGGAAVVYLGRGPVAMEETYGVAQHAFRGSPFCGDGWAIAASPGQVHALLIDGLGHGPVAASAAAAGVEAFVAHGAQAAMTLMLAVDQGMQGTCGGVGALACFEAEGAQLEFVGIGDVAARLVQGTSLRGLASRPGILGVRSHMMRALQYKSSRELLVMHSDGVRDGWRLKDYPGLAHRHPALIAALLHRDFCRSQDDGTVVVVDLDAAARAATSPRRPLLPG